MRRNLDKILNVSALTLVVYTLLVILWGAWVRISHSGDGCGTHWPLCQGDFIPNAPAGKTWIEYAHRLMSGFFGVYVAILWIWIRRQYSAHKKLLLWAHLSMLFTVTEALLGAKLVLFGLVGVNDSSLRLTAMSLHFVNSLMLTGSITMLWLNTQSLLPSTVQNKQAQALSWKIILILPILGVTGACAALASTLFPSDSLLAGLSQDFQADSHFLLRLRILHPILGISLGLFFSIFSYKKDRKILSAFLTLAVLVGLMNLLFHSPTWLKLLHLLLAHLIWMQIVIWWFDLRNFGSNNNTEVKHES